MNQANLEEIIKEHEDKYGYIPNKKVLAKNIKDIVKEEGMKDKCKIEHADICIRCDTIQYTKPHNKLRWNVCGKCAKEMKKIMTHYYKYGLYAVDKEA